MGTNEYSQPASKSSWDSQDFGDVNMVVKMAHFHKSSRPQWVKVFLEAVSLAAFNTPSDNKAIAPINFACHDTFIYHALDIHIYIYIYIWKYIPDNCYSISR